MYKHVADHTDSTTNTPQYRTHPSIHSPALGYITPSSSPHPALPPSSSASDSPSSLYVSSPTPTSRTIPPRVSNPAPHPPSRVSSNRPPQPSGPREFSRTSHRERAQPYTRRSCLSNRISRVTHTEQGITNTAAPSCAHHQTPAAARTPASRSWAPRTPCACATAAIRRPSAPARAPAA